MGAEWQQPGRQPRTLPDSRTLEPPASAATEDAKPHDCDLSAAPVSVQASTHAGVHTHTCTHTNLKPILQQSGARTRMKKLKSKADLQPTPAVRRAGTFLCCTFVSKAKKYLYHCATARRSTPSEYDPQSRGVKIRVHLKTTCYQHVSQHLQILWSCVFTHLLVSNIAQSDS